MASISEARLAPVTWYERLRLPILDVYILKELVWPFAISFAAFFIFWGFNIFFLAAKYLIEQQAPVNLVLRFLLFRLPQCVPFAFPFAALFGTILGMGRLVADNEIIAVRTAGVSLWRICLTPMLFGLATFAITYATNEYISPRATELSTRTFYQIIYNTASLPVEPQFFRKDPDTNNVFYVSQVLPDGKTMIGVQVFKPGRNGYWNESLQAKTAHVDGATLVLTDVIDTRFNPQGYVTAQTQTPEARIGLPLGESAAQFMSSANSDAWTMNSKQLSQQVNALKTQGVGGEALGNMEVNLASKLAFPFACVVAVLLALPMSIRFGRKGRMMGFALSILLFIVYYLMFQAASVFGSTGRANPYLITWMPNAIFGLTGLALLWRDEH